MNLTANIDLVQTFAIPRNKMTKRLKFKNSNDRNKKLVISTNWLVLFDFNAGDRVVERSIGENKGMVIERVYDLFDAPLKTKKVYSRNYKSRRNSPLETLMEVSSKKILNKSFPPNCQKVHIVFTQGKLFITPLTSFQEQAINNATIESQDKVFAACTSGVDLYSLEKNGFSISSVIEYRPCEMRDKKKDLSETGALSVLRNLKNGICNFFNEDITEIDVDQIAKSIAGSPVTLFTASPQCDAFSTVCHQKAKDAAIENLSTTLDMSIDMLRVIEAVKPPVIQFEQVEGWYKSHAYELLKIRLRRKGYVEHLLIADARDHGGLTSRKRGYAVFTCLPSHFAFKDPTPRRTQPIWDLIEPYLDECRNVTHSKSIQDGKSCGRLRIINPHSTKSPTFLKSQSRMAKDSVCIEVDGEFLFPSENLMKKLMGVSDDFKTDCVSKDIASEIIGQSIEVPLHDKVIESIREHIELYIQTIEPKKISVVELA